MKKLLTLRHWQLFLIMVVLPLTIHMTVMWLAIAGRNWRLLFTVLPWVISCFTILYFGWMYTLGTHLVQKLPPGVRMNVNRFKILLSIPLVYLGVIGIAMMKFPAQTWAGESDVSMMAGQAIALLHLGSLCCIFYVLYFNAKALRSVELQKEASFSDCFGEFFLYWFFPVGIWILQPRINKLFETQEKKEDGPILYRND